MASPGRGPIACLEGVGAPALVDVVLAEVRAPGEDVLPTKKKKREAVKKSVEAENVLKGGISRGCLA